MVLTKNELVGKLQHEVRTLLHLASKVDPSMLDYSPTPKQRSCSCATSMLWLAIGAVGRFALH